MLETIQLCAQKKSSASFKKVINKMCLQILFCYGENLKNTK